MTKQTWGFCHMREHAESAELDIDFRAIGWRSFAESYGEELFAELVASLRRRSDMRVHLVGEVRRAWWVVRNPGSGVERASVWRAARKILETMELFEAAGFPAFDRGRFVDCMASACTCDGCDLATGERFARYQTGEELQTSGERGRVAPRGSPQVGRKRYR